MKMMSSPLSSMSGIAKKISRTLAVLSAVGLAWACLPAPAEVITNTFDLGSGTSLEQHAFTNWIAKGTLPPGSILRSASVDAILLSTENWNWADDLTIYVDPTPDTPGGDGLLQIGGYDELGSPTTHIDWANGQHDPVWPVNDTKYAGTDFADTIDLNTVGLFIANGYGEAGYFGVWSGTATVTYDVPGTVAEITTFGLPASPIPAGRVAVINQSAKTIALAVPFGTDPSSLAPSYTLSYGATCDHDNGTTTYDFTYSVPYAVTNSDLSVTNVYTVTVTVNPVSTACDMLSFGPGADISGTNIAWTVPFGTDVASLAPTYTVSDLASGDPTSGTERDFTDPLTYTVTAQDGTTTNDYKVTVAVWPFEYPVTINLAYKNTMDGIASWSQKGSCAYQVAPMGYIGTTWNDGGNGTAAVSPLKDSTGGTTSIGISQLLRPHGARSGDTGMGGNKLVSASLGMGTWMYGDPGILANFQDILTFSGLDPDHAYDFAFVVQDNDENKSAIFKYQSRTADVGSQGSATDWVDGQACALLTNCVPSSIGEITIQEKITADWAPLNGWQILDKGPRPVSTEALIVNFSFPGLGAATISGTNITIGVPFGTDRNGLIPDIVTSTGASCSPDTGIAQDFRVPVQYTVTAEDGITENMYTVTVSFFDTTTTALDVSDSGTGAEILNDGILVEANHRGGGAVAPVTLANGLTFGISVAHFTSGWDNGGQNTDNDPAYAGITDPDFRALMGSYEWSSSSDMYLDIPGLIPGHIYRLQLISVLPAAQVVVEGSAAQAWSGNNTVFAATWTQGAGDTEANVVLHRAGGNEVHFNGYALHDMTPADAMAEILTFTFPSALSTSINQGTLAIHVTVPNGTDVSSVAPTYTTSAGATGDPESGTTPRNFNTAQTYTIISQDTTATNVYTVTVTVLPPVPGGVSDGLAVWLAAEAINPADTAQVDGSGNVLKWNDQSGNGQDAANADTGTRPQYLAGDLNGLPTVKWDGTGKFLEGPSATTIKTIFAVCKKDAEGSGLDGMFCQSHNQDSQNIRGNATDWNFYGDGNDFPNGGGQVYVNGISTGTHNGEWHVLMEVSASSPSFTYQLGQQAYNRFFNGRIAEFIIYNRALSSGEMDQVGGYLADKYNLITAYPPLTPQAKIFTFGPGAAINQATKAIAWTVPYGSDVTSLAPTYTLSTGATGTPVSATARNFTTPQTYTVISSDLLITNVYTVTVTIAPPAPGGVGDGLALWLDASAADTMTKTGSTVNEWRDKFGSSAKATLRGGAPTLVASGIGDIPTVHFDTSAWMNDGVNHSAPVTILYVSRETGGSNGRVLGACNNNWLMGYHGDHRNRFYFEGWVYNSEVGSDTNPHLYAATIGGSGQNSTVWAEGTQLASNQNGVQGPNNLELNGYSSGGELSDCDISEVLVYNRILTGDELNAVGSYLADKYNLTTAYPPLLNQAKIRTFGPGASINDSALTIAWTVPYGTVKSSLAPTFTLSTGATCDHVSGNTYDFTDPVNYAVTNADLSVTNVYTVTVTVAQPFNILDGLVVWFDASNGALTNSSGTVTNWTDLSGHGRNATAGSGAPAFTDSQINGLPAVKFRGNYLNINYNIIPRQEYIVFKSGRYSYDPGNPNYWGNDWGGPFGQQNDNGWMLWPDSRRMWDSRIPLAVSQNGTNVVQNNAEGNPYGMANVADYMVLKVNPLNYGSAFGRIGRPNNSWGDGQVDVAEIIVFDHTLSALDEDAVGGYLATKYGLTTAYPAFSPLVPYGLMATPGDMEVMLAWPAFPGATGYHVRRSTTPGGPYGDVFDASGMTYTNTGLANGTPYYYVVSATTGAGETDNSAEVSATPSSVDAGLSTVVAYLPAVWADGVATSTVTVTLRNGGGIPAVGKTVTLAHTAGPGTPVITTVSGTTDGSGVATFTVTSDTAGVDEFTATDETDGPTVITQKGTVTFVTKPDDLLVYLPGNLPPSSTVNVLKTWNAGLNNWAEWQDWDVGNTYDVYGNKVLGTPGGSRGAMYLKDYLPPEMSYFDSGLEVTYIGASDWPPGNAAWAEMFTWDDDAGNNPWPNGRKGFIINQDPGPGTVRTYAMTGDGSGPSQNWPATDTVGLHTMTLLRLANGDVQAYVDGVLVSTMTGTADPIYALTRLGFGFEYTGNSYVPRGTIVEQVKAFTLSYPVGPVDAGTSTVVASPPAWIYADGSETVTVTVTLKDADGLVVTNKQVTLAATGPGAVTITPANQLTGPSGKAVFTVKSTDAGAYEFTATDNTDGDLEITQKATVKIHSLITWGSATDDTLNGDSTAFDPIDVKTNGTFVAAVTDGEAGTVNGVTFQGCTDYTYPTFTYGSSSISLAWTSPDNGWGQPGNAYGGFGYEGGTDNKLLLTGGGDNSAGEITLSALTEGRQYQVQIWASTWNQTFSPGTTVAGIGLRIGQPPGTFSQYVVGTFTADPTESQKIRWTGIAPTAVSLRDITPSTPPVASFTGGPTSGTVPPGLTVNFTNTSTVGEAPINNCAWDFGDGQTSNTASVIDLSHAYTSIGTFTVILTVTDTNGLSGSVTNENMISVTPRPPVTPPEMLSGRSGFYLDPATGHATVKFTAQDGVQYTLEYKDDLLATDPGWQPCCEPITTNGTPQIMLQDTNDTHNVTQRYYRIEANYP